jgi:hypothetical protein
MGHLLIHSVIFKRNFSFRSIKEIIFFELGWCGNCRIIIIIITKNLIYSSSFIIFIIILFVLFFYYYKINWNWKIEIELRCLGHGIYCVHTSFSFFIFFFWVSKKRDVKVFFLINIIYNYLQDAKINSILRLFFLLK